MQKKLILDSDLLDLTISRLCQQLIENHNDFSETVIIGMQPRGIFVADILHKKLEKDIIAQPEIWLWSHRRWKYKRK